MRRIAITVFHERVAPRLDSADNLILVTVDNGKIKSRELVLLREKDPLRKVDVIFKIKPDLLICGWLTKMCEYKLRHSNIKLIPWVQGNVENILSLCLENTVIEGSYYADKTLSELYSVK
ncbi:MAG: hypothetical protein KJN64_12215 [Ignavibacteria bacterium]|nr:hypothetical protein [Ignavibacteria bacterium]MBT8384022.1 hypothetical protein [Ignavibacteria bacterium]MBT8391960.1 hypothetical protein [Ignavibacteria bacterium]NNJ52177.1 hypothetical protein [Ignavibacteriaceae bacterium]NNL21780.1 hypothetical protein [Ignavibacteriaceae bacterium]